MFRTTRSARAPIARTATRNTSSLRVEQLEDRLTPSWAGVPPSVVPVPTTFTAVTLNANGDASGPAAITSNEIDWYRVTVPAGGVTFSAGNGLGTLDTVIGCFNVS